jgi:hypothetical protein
MPKKWLLPNLRQHHNIFIENWGKLRNTSISTAGLRTEIWSGYLPNMKQECSTLHHDIRLQMNKTQQLFDLESLFLYRINALRILRFMWQETSWSAVTRDLGVREMIYESFGEKTPSLYRG